MRKRMRGDAFQPTPEIRMSQIIAFSGLRHWYYGPLFISAVDTPPRSKQLLVETQKRAKRQPKAGFRSMAP